MPEYNSTLENRFAKHVYPCPMTGCWLWTGYLIRSGYGQIALVGKKWKVMTPAHRASWLIHNGNIPDGMWVLHRCDVRSCVNPSHLFIGTRKENVKDMLMKRRQATGERHGRAKLNNESVLEIRSSLESSSKLAARYGVSTEAIREVRVNNTWKL